MSPLLAVAAVSLAATPSPPPVTELDPLRVTPGIAGFVVFIALALASWVLYRSLLVHIRRVDVRARLEAEEREQAEAQERARSEDDEAADAGSPPSAPPRGHP